MSHRKLELLVAPVKIIHCNRLLEDGRVFLRRDPEHGAVEMPHVVAPDLAGGICQTVRMFVRGAAEQERRRINRARRDDYDIAVELTALPFDLCFNSRNLPRASVSEQLSNLI